MTITVILFHSWIHIRVFYDVVSIGPHIRKEFMLALKARSCGQGAISVTTFTRALSNTTASHLGKRKVPLFQPIVNVLFGFNRRIAIAGGVAPCSKADTFINPMMPLADPV